MVKYFKGGPSSCYRGPPLSKSGSGRRISSSSNSRRRRGAGFFSKFNDFLKNSKIISNVASLFPGPGTAIANVAGNLGYGKRRGRRRRGRGFFGKIKNIFNRGKNIVTNVNNKLKEGKYVSKYAPTISKVVAKLGDISGNEAIKRAAEIASDVGTKAATMGYGKPGRRRGGGKLPVNGMGRYGGGGGSLTPQGRLNAFVAKRLSMIH